MATKSKGKSTGQTDRSPICHVPEIPRRPIDAGIDRLRERLIRVNEKKWVNGTVLRYYFFNDSDGSNQLWVGPDAQRKVVRDAFTAWKNLGIGLEFREVQDRHEAEIRIGFDQSDGSWSYVGRDVVDYATDPNERTMNFGWDLRNDYGRDTALHEIGHTLGFPHEHQNPNAGIVWDEQAVLDYFGGPPNYWPADTTQWNVLRKLDQSEVSGSTWDPDSIMHYSFESGLIVSPAHYKTGLTPAPGLSQVDIDEVKKFYPALAAKDELLLEPYQSRHVAIEPGQQVNFRIRPTFTQRYTIQTFGRADTVAVLFEDHVGEAVYIDGDDDSGYERNAKIVERLYRGREYILRIRLYWRQTSGQTAVFIY